MIYLSASLIKDYLVCKQRVSYRVNSPENSVQTDEMALGTLVHYILEKNATNKVRALASIKPAMKEHNSFLEEAAVVKLVENFFKMFPDSFFSKKDQIEKYFKVKYKDDIMFTGRIDRIHDGIVYDWKTSKAPPQDINRDPQFIMYYLAYKKLYGAEPASLVYVSLLHKKLYYFKPVRSIIDEFENSIIPEVKRTIASGAYTKDGLYKWSACNNCSFQENCWSRLGIKP